MPKEPVSGKLKIKQYETYKDNAKRYEIASEIIRTKVEKSKTLLIALSDYYEALNKDEISEVFGREVENSRRNDVILREKVDYFPENRTKQKINNPGTEKNRNKQNKTENNRNKTDFNPTDKINKIEKNKENSENFDKITLSDNYNFKNCGSDDFKKELN